MDEKRFSLPSTLCALGLGHLMNMKDEGLSHAILEALYKVVFAHAQSAPERCDHPQEASQQQRTAAIA